MFPLLYSDHRLMTRLANSKPAAVSAGFDLCPSASICGFPLNNLRCAVLRFLRSLLFFSQKETEATEEKSPERLGTRWNASLPAFGCGFAALSPSVVFDQTIFLSRNLECLPDPFRHRL